jgi:hypothetical protein
MPLIVLAAVAPLLVERGRVTHRHRHHVICGSYMGQRERQQDLNGALRSFRPCSWIGHLGRLCLQDSVLAPIFGATLGSIHFRLLEVSWATLGLFEGIPGWSSFCSLGVFHAILGRNLGPWCILIEARDVDKSVLMKLFRV